MAQRKPPPAKPDSLKSRRSPLTMAQLERTPEDKQQDRKLLRKLNRQRVKA